MTNFSKGTIEYHEPEYKTFLGYVKSTWSSLLECNDFDLDTKIETIVIHNYKNQFEVFVYLNKDASYHDYKDGKVIKIDYDGKPIKTSYYLESSLVLFIILKGSILEDLGVSDAKLIINDFVDGIETNKELSKKLEIHQEGWAEDYHCYINDL